MHVSELNHRTRSEESLVIHAIEDFIMHECRTAFVHHLGLALRIKVLGKDSYDPKNLTLPVFQLG
ncbi:MAG: hypothetical protein RLZ84_1707 [Actinomycetota bacterium]